jgi:outer membrane protein assembly factor BamD
MNAYSHYLADKYDDAIIALDRFIDLHPGNRDIAYAYYLRAISYYEQIVDVSRDQRITQLALDSLQQVVQRFPNTEYARDASLKIDLTRDHLAGKEMAIGRYYLERDEHFAAINRFKTVIENYQTTTHVPEALHRLVESYLALGITQEAQMAAAVLGHNFPGSDWYRDSYGLLEGRDLAAERDDESWLSATWNWIF